MREKLEVHWTSENGTTTHVGTLQLRGWVETQEFTYASDWLVNGFSIGEGLPLTPGPLLPPGGMSTFGLFDDAGPDTWGRHVIQRTLPMEEWKNSLSLLAATPDLPRQGALRFADTPGGPFLRETPDTPLPWRLSKLSEVQADIAAFLAGSEDRELLRRLHAGSSSQGGARPKSTLIGEDGELFIAKFPAETDRYDVQACEAVALSAARAAGLPTPDFQLERFDSDRCVLVLRRFDRTAAGRLGYQSMKTACLLSPYEEFTYKTAISTARYLSGRHSALNVVGAAALAICMHNIDDHAKNFGFVRRNSTWELAPVFDVVPFPLDESGTPLDSSRMPRTLEHLLGIDWGIPKPDVLKVVSRVAHACWHAWDQAPSSFGLDESEANRVKRFIRSACDFSAVLTGGEPKF